MKPPVKRSNVYSFFFLSFQRDKMKKKNWKKKKAHTHTHNLSSTLIYTTPTNGPPSIFIYSRHRCYPLLKAERGGKAESGCACDGSRAHWCIDRAILTMYVRIYIFLFYSFSFSMCTPPRCRLPDSSRSPTLSLIFYPHSITDTHRHNFMIIIII